ncbi:hypothetical protein [Microseira wollei]|uniref:DUF996 domain-containing protein n=1 Tax=Microseira wollei NIES-4236 TaxID=2530354 RepID=A0AAV3XLR8_9CYAN|nr:hypothetical protein [Microseira wollei]GET42553.1 hypothetical protein MiSe_73710 [Microseira wollei NIES-4236]
MSKTVKNLSTLTTALVLFGLSGSAIAAFVPYLFAGSETPNFAVFFVVGMAIILLTAILFGYIDRLGMGFGKTTIVLATGYNALIAAVKLWLAPAALYQIQISNNALFLFPFIGVAILLLYLVVFKVIYQIFKRRLQWSNGELRAQSSALRVALSIFAVVFISIVTIFLGFVLFVVAGLDYLGIFATSIGFVIIVALVLAAILAATTFDQVEKRAFELGQATLLANFFWLGCILIALYHAMWLIFLLTLFSIWPLRTYSPK